MAKLKKSQVKDMQWLMQGHNRHGIKTYGGKLDGIAGEQTRAAWRKTRWLLGFTQGSYRLPATPGRYPWFRALMLPMKLENGKSNPAADTLPKGFQVRRRKRQKAAKRPVASGNAVVKWASSQVGVMESPVGSNSGGSASSGVRWYQAATFLGGSGWPWCAAFCCRAWSEVYGYVPRRSAGAWDFTDHGGISVAVANIRAGDCVSYATGSGHINIATGPPKGGRIPTIGGNESDGVRRSSWPTSIVHSACRHPRAA